ncbi:MAG: hypothetical protein LBE13_21550 [Bacteroidales bacterium]|jgi:hypothetical protein|nr:hypothetical protein [Bacteroidales bacterium]
MYENISFFYNQENNTVLHNRKPYEEKLHVQFDEKERILNTGYPSLYSAIIRVLKYRENIGGKNEL